MTAQGKAPPFHWEPGDASCWGVGLDAAFLGLYGISRDDAAYLPRTLPVVHRKDEAAHGTCRTKHFILEPYDVLTSAIPHQTLLGPPPPDSRCRKP